ncbi:MAG: hypothetical protein JOZ89_11615, partial [Gammaproteobacteria bacterium]|nr:hypothetical protein [Gammaproteobacteria bacterium]
AAPSEAQINGAFSAAPQEELKQVAGSLEAGIAAIKSITAIMVEKQGVQAAPDTGPLSETLARMQQAVAPHIRVPVGDGSAGSEGDSAGEVAIPGQIRSREEAIRSLDAISEFFRRAEPSSPVPLFVDRAKRLIARDFLELLAELAPDSLAAVKQVGGIRDEE